MGQLRGQAVDGVVITWSPHPEAQEDAVSCTGICPSSQLDAWTRTLRPLTTIPAAPGDISLVGSDDIPEAEYFVPPLTTVRQDFTSCARLARERPERRGRRRSS